MEDSLYETTISSIIKKRIKQRSTYYINNEQKNIPCCSENKIKIIQTHGFIDNTKLPDLDETMDDTKKDSSLLHLKEGYKVILIAQYGETICLNLNNIEKLKNIYRSGSTLFKNQDTDTVNLTSQGNNWRNTMVLGKNQPIDIRLYIGGAIDLTGNSVESFVPNVLLYFGGSNCDYMKTSMDGFPYVDYNCYIDCIEKDTKIGDESRCNKYYYDDVTYSKKNEIDIVNSGGIYLKELLEKEGKGTYIIISCLQAARLVSPNELAFQEALTKSQKFQSSHVSFRTRDKKSKLTKTISKVLKKKARGKKTRYKKCKSKKCKKCKSCKRKKKKCRSRKRKNTNLVKENIKK
tara:strand:- start:6790 stop:7833 length:1044 start_codon:yes stop_codon:yes gene_type:complete